MFNFFLHDRCSNSYNFTIYTTYTIITYINSYHYTTLKEIVQPVLDHWATSNFTRVADPEIYLLFSGICMP